MRRSANWLASLVGMVIVTSCAVASPPSRPRSVCRIRRAGRGGDGDASHFASAPCRAGRGRGSVGSGFSARFARRSPGAGWERSSRGDQPWVSVAVDRVVKL